MNSEPNLSKPLLLVSSQLPKHFLPVFKPIQTPSFFIIDHHPRTKHFERPKFYIKSKFLLDPIQDYQLLSDDLQFHESLKTQVPLSVFEKLINQ